MSWACLENLNIPPCVWFQNGENRNAIASIVAGILVSIAHLNSLHTIC